MLGASRAGRAAPRSPPMFRILRETPDDSAEVEFLYDLAFAPGRTALSSYRLRDGVDARRGAVPGRARRLRCARGGDPLLAGADRRGRARRRCCSGRWRCTRPARARASGALLIAESLERAAGLGWSRVVLVGDEPYYRRFGFTREAGAGARLSAADQPRPPAGPGAGAGGVRRGGGNGTAVDRGSGRLTPHRGGNPPQPAEWRAAGRSCSGLSRGARPPRPLMQPARRAKRLRGNATRRLR